MNTARAIRESLAGLSDADLRSELEHRAQERVVAELNRRCKLSDALEADESLGLSLKYLGLSNSDLVNLTTDPRGYRLEIRVVSDRIQVPEEG